MTRSEDFPAAFEEEVVGYLPHGCPDCSGPKHPRLMQAHPVDESDMTFGRFLVLLFTALGLWGAFGLALAAWMVAS